MCYPELLLAPCWSQFDQICPELARSKMNSFSYLTFVLNPNKVLNKDLKSSLQDLV